MSRIFIICLLFIFISCSKESTSTSTTQEQEIEEPVFVLDAINVETLSDSPEGFSRTKMIYNDKLYTVYEDKTFMYDLKSNTWSLILGSDIDLDNTHFYFGNHTNFIKDNKWYLLSDRELLEYNFEQNDWTKIETFPISNGRFYVHGIFKDDAIYFVDKGNGNPDIYKYDFETSNVTTIGSYDNPGDRGPLSNSIFEINGSYYYAQILARGMRFSKFSSDFENLETLNEFNYENNFDNAFSGASTWVYDDKIIFGLGGSITQDSNGETIVNSLINNKLFSYDTKTNEFSSLENTPIEEACIAAQTFSYNNEYYLFDGITINNEKVERRNLLQKLTFNIVEKQP